MTTGTKVFIIIAIVILLAGFYFITQANKPATVAPAKTPTEPTANIWTVIGGVMDIFNKGPEGNIGTDVSGQFVDSQGYLVNKDGEYVNADGIVLTMVEVPVKYTKLV